MARPDAPAGEATKFSLLDATVVLAVATGLLHLSGYFYYAAFYGALGIPLDSAMPHSISLLVFGSLSPLLFAGFLSLLWFFASAWLEHRHSSRQLLGRTKGTFKEVVGHRGFQAVALIVTVFLCVSVSDKSGRTRAVAFLAGDCRSVEVIYLPPGTTGSKALKGCLGAMTEAMVWVRLADSDNRLQPIMRAVPAGSVVELTIGDRLRHLPDDAN